MLTPEQCEAVAYYAKELPMKVIAFAGAGKTSTLVTMAKQAPYRRGFYLAFNKSIATEAATKFPRSVTCKTTHSVAFGACVRQGYSADRKLLKDPYSRQFEVTSVRGEMPMHVDTFKSIVAATVKRFCQSNAREIKENHVPRVPGLSPEDQEFLYRWAPMCGQETWNRMTDAGDDLPLGGDGYVKVWALSNPRIASDYIFVDEAQDLNPVLIGVIRDQQAQIVAVGDSHQQIYEWRGAKDALNILPGHECRLTRSFRFGDAIAQAANGCLTAMGERFPLHGFEVIRDEVINHHPRPDAVLCRSNAGVLERAMEFLDGDRAVYTPGGTGEMRALVQDAEALKAARPARSASLMGFKTWKQVQDFAATEEGASLKVFVNLVGKYGPRRLLDLLERIDDKPSPGCVTIATGHKAKGLEWPVVEINADFLQGDGEDSRISVAERRLFYVAITRAKQTLAIDPLMLEAYSTSNDDDED